MSLKRLEVEIDANLQRNKNLVYEWVKTLPTHLDFTLIECNIEDLIVFKHLNPDL